MQTPRELIDFDQWILWRYEDRDGKRTKVPCHASGRPASVTDPRAWHTYADALDAYRDSDGALAGVGFCFTEHDPFVGVDLDGCWPRLSPAAREILAHLPSYAEISPSGTGIKVFVRGTIAAYSRSRTTEVPGFGQIEVYEQGRFFTVTGERFGMHPAVTDCQEGLDWVMETYLPNPVAPAAREGTGTGAATEDDAEILDLMFGFANGEQARRLYGGDISAYGDDQSAADMALVAHLAFVVGDDPDRVDRLFRGSALMRDKWDSRRGASTYGERTIEKVLDEMTDFYTPPGTPDPELSAWADDLVGGSGKLPSASDVPVATTGAGQTPPPAAASEATGEEDVEVDPLLDGSTAPDGDEVPAAAAAKQQAPEGSSSAAASFPIPERGLIRDVVDLFAGRTEVPDETLALCMLATMSAVTGWNRYIKWGESTEPAIIYAQIVGKSALAKKSTGMRTVSSLWHEAGVDVSLTAQHASGRALVEAAMGGIDIFKVKPAKVPLEATPEEALAIEAENMDLVAKQQEKLNNPPPVVLEWDEFGTMLDVRGRWQEDTRVQLLQLYNGRHSGIQTTGRDGLKVPGGKASMALIGTMTMEDLCRSLNMGQVGDGLIGRILFSPPGEEKPPLAKPPTETDEYLAARARVVDQIRAYAERVTMRAYHAYDGWTTEADTVYNEWYMRMHAVAKEDGLIGAMFGRGAVTVVKIVALLAGAESTGWDEDAAGVTVVEAHHMRQAIAIVEASWRMAQEAVTFQTLSQRDRWCDAAVDLLRVAGQMSQWELTRRALVPKEPGDYTVDQHTRAGWVDADPRMELDKTNNRGFVVRLK